MGLAISQETKPLTAEDVKKMKEAAAANKQRDQANAYDICFSNFCYFAVKSFNNNVDAAIKANSDVFRFAMTTKYLDGSIDKYLRDTTLDTEFLYRCSNFYIKTYPDFEIKHELDAAGTSMIYIVNINPVRPTAPPENTESIEEPLLNAN